MRRFALRLYISTKYITANVIDRTTAKLVASASTVEPPIARAFACGRNSTPTAAAAVAEVLAMRLKVQGVRLGVAARGVHSDLKKEMEKKGEESKEKIVWAILNGLRDNGVKLILDGDDR